MAQFFDYDPRKARTNSAKHRVSFEDAITTFADTFGLDLFDEEHSSGEDRWVRLGRSYKGVLLTTVYTVYADELGECVRIISARRATVAESAAYQDHRRSP